MTMRSASRVTASALCALVIAACTHSPTQSTGNSAPSPAGTLSIARTGAAGDTTRLEQSVVYRFSTEGNVVAANQTRWSGNSRVSTQIRAAFASSPGGPVLVSFAAKDTLGNTESVHYERNGASRLVEYVPGLLQLNRIGSADGAYREVEKITEKNATIVSRMRADAAGNGAWTIQLYPRSAESGTYYGVLNDAEMQRDLTVRAVRGAQRWSADKVYAVGYDAPSPMHEISSGPAADSTASHRPGGTVETVRSEVRPAPAGRYDVIATATAAHRLWPPSRGGVTTVTVSESVTVPSRLAAAVVLEDARRLMGIELEKMRISDTLVAIRGQQ